MELKLVFEDFLKKAAAELSKGRFRLISGGGYEYAALYARAEAPVLYMVAVVNFDSVDPEKYERFINSAAEEILKDNGGLLNNAVCVNVLYSPGGKAADFADVQEDIRQRGVHNIWWYTDGEELYSGKGQPDRIFGIEKCLKRALEPNPDTMESDIGKISRENYERTAIKASEGFPVFTAAVITANIIIFLVQTVLGRTDEYALRYGINGALVFMEGQYYRLFTYMFIHAGLEHILPNMFFLFIYGSRFEKYAGRLNMAIVYILSGLAGGLLSSAANMNGIAVGASGALFGILGAFLVMVKKSGQSLGGIGYMTMLAVVIFNLGMGMLSSGVDNFGHAGGLAAGLLLELLIYKKHNIGDN